MTRRKAVNTQRFCLKFCFQDTRNEYTHDFFQKSSISGEIEMFFDSDTPLECRSDAVSKFLSMSTHMIRNLHRNFPWNELIWMPPEKRKNAPDEAVLNAWKSKLGYADIFCNGELLSPDSDLVGSTVDGLTVVKKGSLVGRDGPYNSREYIAVTLSDGTHRILGWYGDKGFEIFNFWNGFGNVSHGENSSKAIEMVKHSKLLPRLEWSTEDPLSFYVRVYTDEGRFVIVCQHSYDGLDPCGVFLYKLIPPVEEKQAVA